MEQELNKMFDPIKKKSNGFMDFGFGAAQPYQPGYADSTLFIIWGNTWKRRILQ